MIQVYADDFTVYDSRLPDRGLLGLKAHPVLNKSGTAEIVIPPGHPAYNAFTGYRTLVEIYRDNRLLFRGRALYPKEDFHNVRTVICEGERGFLRDSVSRPYLYQDSPEAIFTALIEQHNAQVEEFKTFTVGTVTAEDPNDYIRLESEKAEQTLDTIDKLVERVGGYIVFTTNAEGRRVINWYGELGYQSKQAIEFGENLLDFVLDGSNTALANVIIPYGAKDEETGERLTIESVNDGLDYIRDDAAIALRGMVAKPVYFDDVTLPENLLRKAQQYLATSKMVISTLQLSAVDLSLIDKSIDSFMVGDMVKVRSKPHGVDDYFQLRERAYDLLHPENDTVTLGKDLASMTGADVAGDRNTVDQLHKTEINIKADYNLGIANAVEETKRILSTLIQQTSESIMMEVSETYAKNGDVESKIGTTFEQLKDSFSFEFTTLKEIVDSNDADARKQFETISKYIRFEDGNIILGETGNELVLRIKNDRISFLDSGAEVAYFSNKKLYVLDGQFLNSLQIGLFKFIPRENGNLSLVRLKYGGD